MKLFRFDTIEELFKKEKDDIQHARDGHMSKYKKKMPPLFAREKRTKKIYGHRVFAIKKSTPPDYHSSKQLCVLKAKFAYNRKLNKKHLDYIKREGTGLNGENPDIYGAHPETYEDRMSKLHFRFIISPENQTVDLKLLTKEFIDRLEMKTGYKFDWVAADHYNTGHRHTHLLINGFDLKGRRVRFSKIEIKELMRETLKDICTQMVGSRSYSEQQDALFRQTTSNSYTGLDKRIDTMISPGGILAFNRIANSNHDSLLHRRMMHLKDLGLAQWDTVGGNFILKDDWKEKLRIFGRYNTFLKTVEMLNVNPANLKFHKTDDLGTISGKVVKRYYMQDDSNNHAIVLETAPGKYAYVPLYSLTLGRCGVSPQRGERKTAVGGLERGGRLSPFKNL